MHFFKAKIWLLAMLGPLLSLAQQPQTITGTVINSNGEPVVNASITAKHSRSKTETNAEGVFSIVVKAFPDTLWISHVGYSSIQYPLNNQAKGSIVISLSEAANQLDETVVIAYGKTTRRMNTGSVARMTARTIGQQPVADPLQAMAGRMTGVTVTQGSGHAGTTTKIQVRGRNSIAQGSDPLFIIDGVPFAPGNESVNRLNSQLSSGAGTGLSGFYNINPADIESIEVLKDADATAIYGSRGANGVVLITTKKGVAGATRVQADVRQSLSSITRTMPMLSTPQYLALRREAFANDGVTPTATNAADLVLFDSTRQTDFREYFTGGRAQATDVQLAISGGSERTRFTLSGNYRREGSVLPGDFRSKRMGGHLGFTHISAGNKLNIQASASYSNSDNGMTGGDLSYYINLAPNFPSFYDSTGRLSWQHKGYQFHNPMAYTETPYRARANNLMSRALIGYKVVPALTLSASLGYNHYSADETSTIPIAAQNPANGALGTLNLAQSVYQNWIVEPQAEYRTRLLKGTLTVLAGGTLQNNSSTGLQVQGTGYTSDQLLQSLAAAPNTPIRKNSFSRYRYQAVFARVQYNYENRYLLSVSGRRDGSSRFGPGNRYSNFAAAGAAWIFSDEAFIKSVLPVLSFGKLRASYGTAGNDQIGNYNYLDNWNATSVYNGTAGLYPTNLFNANYQWEVNRKLEAALELGFFKDRLLVNAAWFRNRSGNQLVAYRLPTQTGFPTILKNMPAVVQNSGVEISVSSEQVKTADFSWSSSLNLTLPRNKLLSFPGLETSSYASSYVIGEPLSVIYKLQSLGVDSATGVFAFADLNKDGVVQLVKDYTVAGHTDPEWYGGLQNDVRYKNLSLSVFFEFKKQTGRNVFGSIYQSPGLPGMMYNMPAIIEERWRRPGDVASIQRVSMSTTSAASRAVSNFLNSDGIYSDASYLRLKTLALQYTLPEKWMKQLKLRTASIFLQGQNLLTITRYKGSDPETQQLYVLPPLKTIAVGMSVGM